MTQRILRTGVNNKKGRKDTSNKSMIFGSDKKKMAELSVMSAYQRVSENTMKHNIFL